MDNRTVKRSIFSYIFLFAIIAGIILFMNLLNTKVNKLTYSEFLNNLENNKVVELTITPNSSQGIYSLTGKLSDYGENEKFTTSATLSEETLKQIYDLKSENEIDIKVAKDPGSSLFLLFLVNILPIIIILRY